MLYTLPSFDSGDRRAGVLLHQLVLYRGWTQAQQWDKPWSVGPGGLPLAQPSCGVLGGGLFHSHTWRTA